MERLKHNNLLLTRNFEILVLLLGQVFASVGSGLLIMLDVSTPTAAWATFLALAGFGDGLCLNIPFIAIQAILEE